MSHNVIILLLVYMWQNNCTTASGIAVQSRPAPLQGHETMLQKRFAMVRGRFAMP